MVDYKGGRCEVCGYRRCIGAMDFHHRNPKRKRFALSQCFAHEWLLIERELDGCALLCANCHREYHAGLTSLPVGMSDDEVDQTHAERVAIFTMESLRG